MLATTLRLLKVCIAPWLSSNQPPAIIIQKLPQFTPTLDSCTLKLRWWMLQSTPTKQLYSRRRLCMAQSICTPRMRTRPSLASTLDSKIAGRRSKIRKSLTRCSKICSPQILPSSKWPNNNWITTLSSRWGRSSKRVWFRGLWARISPWLTPNLWRPSQRHKSPSNSCRQKRRPKKKRKRKEWVRSKSRREPRRGTPSSFKSCKVAKIETLSTFCSTSNSGNKLPLLTRLKKRKQRRTRLILPLERPNLQKNPRMPMKRRRLRILRPKSEQSQFLTWFFEEWHTFNETMSS